MAAVDAKALADYGTDRYGMRYPVHFTAWRTSQMSVLLSYCMIPFLLAPGILHGIHGLPMLVIRLPGTAGTVPLRQTAGPANGPA